MRKIQSVVEIAKYKIGSTAYWVTLRAVGDSYIELPESEEWITEEHPKFLYSRGYDKSWNTRSALPKLHELDFKTITLLLTSQFVVEPFHISNIIRSPDTGEFYYINNEDDTMPESYLMATEKQAIRERNRIMKMLNKWSSKR